MKHTLQIATNILTGQVPKLPFTLKLKQLSVTAITVSNPCSCNCLKCSCLLGILSPPPLIQHFCSCYNNLKEHFTGGLALAEGTLRRDQRTWKHDSLDTPGVITMVLLLAAFHFVHQAETNAFSLHNKHIYRQENTVITFD